MTINHARQYVIKASLLLLTIHLAYLLVAPGVGIPGNAFPHTIRLLEIVCPVFVGYLGTAVVFVFSPNRGPEVQIPPAHRAMVGLLIRGPIWIFSIGSAALYFAFAWSNRGSADLFQGNGMSVDDCALALSILLGLLSGTTSVAVSFLFRVEHA